jgi:hypothetical protein
MTHAARFTALAALAVFALSCTDTPTAPPDPSFHKSHGNNDPCRAPHPSWDAVDTIEFRCAISIPSPLTGSQKGWAEQSNAKYFLTDASANGVHVINIKKHEYVGLIGGMAGAATTGGGTATTNGPGPNSFVSAPRFFLGWLFGGDRVLFVSDGNSTVHVIDMHRLQIIKSISTAVQAGEGIPDNQVCDDGTAHYCGRANEIAYDPFHHVVIVQNPSPLALTGTHAAQSGYATFISARYPYNVLGHVFPGPGTLEGQVFVPQMNRCIMPVQNNPTTPGVQQHLIINTRTREIEATRSYTCADIPGAGANGNNNLQLAPFGNLWAQMCGRPIRIDVRTGTVKNVVTQLGTGDQDWYNSGDGNFYNTGAFPPAIPPAAAGPARLGVVNGITGEFKQAVENPGGASPSAYAKTNEIFTRVPFTAANDPLSRCTVKGTGCVVVFGHSGRVSHFDFDDH